MSTAPTQSIPTPKEIQSAKRRLGKSDLSITPIGLGAWAIGGGRWEFAWGSQDDSESISAIRRSVSLGVNWIDTAPVYGLGHSEEMVHEALKDIPTGERPYVFTKCTLIWNEARQITHDMQADSIRRECESSLKRLGVDSIDLYQMHWPARNGSPDGSSPGSIEEALGALADLKKQGKIRYIGVSNFTVQHLERAVKVTEITSLQPPYSMLRPAAEQQLLPWCQAHNLGVIVYSPMLSGLLTGKMTKDRVKAFPDDDWRRNNVEFKEPKLSRNLDLVEKLREIASRHGRSPGEVAIAWTLRNSAVTAAIVGGRSEKQVEGIAGAATFRLNQQELSEIEKALANLA